MLLIDAVGDIFGMRNQRTTWDDVKRRVTPEAIRELHQAVGFIWRADPKHLIPKPTSSLSALYLGDIDPDGLARRVFRFGLYTDEIYVIDPFQFPAPPGRDPISQPHLYRYDTLHLLAFLIKVEPWIRAGRLTLIPDPMRLDPLLWARALANVEKRKLLLGNPTDEEIEEVRESMLRRLASIPFPGLVQRLREMHPDLDEDELAKRARSIEAARRADSMAFADADVADQFTFMRGGTSLESMQRICMQSGAFPFTHSPFKWRELFLTVDKMSDLAKVWSPLTNAFSGLEFEFLNNVDPAFAARLREEERLTGFRQFLRDVWAKAGATPDLANAESAAKEFRERLGEEYRKAREEWKQIRRDVNQFGVTAAVSAAGVLANAILTGGMSVHAALVTIALAAIGPAAGQAYSWKVRKPKLRVTLPMTVFIDLSEHRPKPPKGTTLGVSVE